MKIAILGYGKEGKAAEAYFAKQGAEIQIFDKFTDADLDKMDFSGYDLILRSPSVKPRPEFSSVTRYFFENSKAPVIGVTGTKGKGTTCSLITAILKALGKNVYLLGNIGNPAIEVLDELTEKDVVVYEMSSFQLWDMTQSPQVAVVLRIEPEHLDVHGGFDGYLAAKGNIARYQGASDVLVYFKDSEWSAEVAGKSQAERKFAYPESEKSAEMVRLLKMLGAPGEHNKENAEAALLAVAGFLGVSVTDLVREYFDEIGKALSEFTGLPHHIEFVRNLNGVEYYDDSFSTSYPALDVAMKAFDERPVVLIAGGKDHDIDLAPTKKVIFGAKNLVKAVLIGEIKKKLTENEDADKYVLVKSLEEAVAVARKEAEMVLSEYDKLRPVVLLSPGAASLDMFKSYYERGDIFKGIVNELK